MLEERQEAFYYLRLMIEIGHIDNPGGKEGLVHLAEHQMFNAGDLLAEQVKKKFEMASGKLNAVTNNYWLIIEARIPQRRERQLLGIISDMIMRPQWSANLLREKGVVASECMRQVNHATETALANKLRKHFPEDYVRYESLHNALGSQESLGAITELCLSSQCGERIKKNIKYAVIGGSYGKFVFEWLSGLPQYAAPERKEFLFDKTLPPGVSFDSFSVSSELNVIGTQYSAICYMGLASFAESDRFKGYQLRLLTVSALARLVMNQLRSKNGLIYDITTLKMYELAGNISCLTLILNATGKDLDEFKKHLDVILTSPISKREFKACKRRYTDGIKYSDNNAETQVEEAIICLKSCNRVVSYDESVELINMLTYEEFDRHWQATFMNRLLCLAYRP